VRVAHYLPRIRLEEGGVVRAVLDLAGALAGAGVAVDLLTHDPADAPGEWRADGAGPRIVTLPPPGFAGLLSAPARRAAGEALADAQVVHLHTPWERANVQIARAATRRGAPYVVSAHGMLDDWCMAHRGAKKRLYLRLAGRRLLERAACVHCTAEAELRQASRWFPRGRGSVVPLVVDLAPFRSLPGPGEAQEAFDLSTDRPVVLFLSRVHEKKGVDILLRAFAAVRGAHDATLVVAGPGEERYVQAMRALAESLGLRDSVRFPGMVGGSRKLSLYQAAAVFALPTHQENFGLVLPEALACATPVVTTKGVDIWPELERSGGALIRDGVPEAFAEAIGDLLARPEHARAMGEAGREWVLRELDGASVVGRYIAMYEEAQR
jgi:glycosyltransferase involved in cell wall biosynthesis